MIPKLDVHQNRLLAALPAAEFGRLSPHLELLALPAGEVLSEAAREAAYVYFPATAVVCLLCLLESGMSTGLAIVGNDGMVDVALVLGGATPSAARSCRVPGTCTGSAHAC